MRRFIKLGLALAGVFCLMAGSAWAQEDDAESTTQTTTTGATGSSFISF